MTDARHDILKFWFEETKPQQWFQADPDFDALIHTRFADIYEMAARGVLDDWKNDADGCLALCIVVDQFPRNMFRGTAKAFATDAHAIAISRYAVSKGFDQRIEPARRRFLYLPFEHAENLNDQRTSVALFETIKKDDPQGYDYAQRHLDVIEQFGRFPHRNAILGRTNTPEEVVYLAKPGSGF